MHMRASDRGEMTQAWWLCHALGMYEMAAQMQDEVDAIPGRRRVSQHAIRFGILGDEAMANADRARALGGW